MKTLHLLYRSMRQQHLHYFFNKRIYLSLGLWPILGFITTYYSYKPFAGLNSLISLGLKTQGDVYVYLLIGFVAMTCFYVFIQSAWQSAYGIRSAGALELLYLSPANRMIVLLGHSMASLFGSIWVIVLFAVGTVFYFPESITFHLSTMVFSLFLLLFAAICWGTFLHSLFLSTRDAGFLYTIFQDPVQMFTGAKLPHERMPLWAQTIGWIFPLTYVIKNLRYFLMENGTLRGGVKNGLISMGMSGILLLLAWAIAYFSEKNAKKNGSAILF